MNILVNVLHFLKIRINYRWNYMKYKDIDSPSLLIFKDRVVQNIREMIRVAGGTARLMPHVKTNKMEAVIRLMMAEGITRFKAATIAEAELAAMAGAESVLISHQLVGPKIHRLKNLVEKYPATAFSTLADCREVADELSRVMEQVSVYLDINNGMNRTGHEVNEDLGPFLDHVLSKGNILVRGLHIYDGHITDADFSEREKRVDQGMHLLDQFIRAATEKTGNLELVCGGSPAFTAHVKAENRILSPGTSVFWDWGYGDKFTEQHFSPAAWVLTRVISKPAAGIITVDMGHKAVSAENPVNLRIRFPENPDLRLISQSEEHGVLETDRWENYRVGDVLLGIPYHVCPTVNLYDQASVFDQGKYAGTWEIAARKRKITV